jgi:hypothetical protein
MLFITPNYVKKAVQECLRSLHQADRREIRQAIKLLQRARTMGRLRRLWAQIRGIDNHLRDLGQIAEVNTIHGWRYIGLQSVNIDQIVGCEEENHEFDGDFYPTSAHNQVEWLCAAIIRQMGDEPPPVDLIQVGPDYYVQSGVYPISVTRAMGIKDIHAYVTRWVLNNKVERAWIESKFSSMYKANARNYGESHVQSLDQISGGTQEGVKAHVQEDVSRSPSSII